MHLIPSSTEISAALMEQFGDNYKAIVSDYGSAKFFSLHLYCMTWYSAPESDDPSQQSIKMDVYSFGLLLIEMC